MAHGRVPAKRERTRTCTPATYCRGSASSHWPSPLSANAVATDDAARASTVRTVALGVPVEPEVRTTTAASSKPGVSTAETTMLPSASAESSTAGPSPWRASARARRAESMFAGSMFGGWEVTGAALGVGRA